MKKTFSLFILSTTFLLSETYIKIQDTSDLPILSADLKERVTEKIELANGLGVLLISDPKADMSSACVCVEAGSWCDPKEYPGMAHFCEHMLFMGTEKYPDTNDFFATLSNFQGTANAYTASNKTVYMFASQEKGFLSLLDRFSHFFIDPLFDPSNISREMHAVDQEFALQKEHDGWRGLMVFKEMGNKEHPNHLFSTGNSKTLSNIPQSALKNWHKKHYGANRMRVAIYSSLPLETLKSTIQENFALVPKDAEKEPNFAFELTSESQKGQITYIEPVKNLQHLSLSWELPPSLVSDESKSADLIAYTLQRSGKQSLMETLKKAQLIDDMGIHVDRHRGKTHAFFEIDLALTNEGVQNVEEVISILFQSLQSLKKTGVSENIFNEKNTLAKLSYQFQKRKDAFEYISSIGDTLTDEPLTSYPRKTLLGSSHNPQKIGETLSFLTPDECVITLLAPKAMTQAEYNNTEKWLQVDYTSKPVPLNWKNTWAKALPHPSIRLSDVNPYIPQDLTVFQTNDVGENPICIAESDFGSAYYVRLSEFQTPESAIHLRILTPEIQNTTKSQVLSSLLLDHFTDQIQATLIAANSAKIGTAFELEQNQLHITLTGFSDKMPLLLQEIVSEIPGKPPTREEFALYFERHQKGYMNSLKEKPYQQAAELMKALVNQQGTKTDKLKILQNITFEDFEAYHKRFLEKVHLQVLFAGNLPLKTAESSWLDITHSIGKNPYPKVERSTQKSLHLPDDEGPFMITKETSSQGHAAILLLDEGNFSLKQKSIQKMLAAALKEPFFDTLRTKQKTGYVAQSRDLEAEKRLYQFFVVQSNSHQPEDLLHRFELFLEEFREDMKNQVTQERFDILKTSLIETLQTQYRNLPAKAALYEYLAFDENGNFSHIDQRIQGFQELSYEEFLTEADQILSRKNHKRLAILYQGQIDAPFTYSPVTRETFEKSVTYAPKPQDLAQ